MNAMLFLLVKVSVVLGTAWLVHAALAGGNPRWRVLLWRTAAAATIIVTVLSAFPPLVHLRVLEPHRRGDVDAVDAVVSVASRLPEPQSTERTAGPASAPTTMVTPTSESVAAPTSAPENAAGTTGRDAERITDHRAPRPSPAFLAFACWAVGVLAASAWAAIGLARLRRVKAGASPAPRWIIEEAANVACRFGLRSHFKIALTREVQSPCLIGVWRPLVLLPPSDGGPVDRGELSSVLAHELAHLKGNDPAFNSLWHVLSILFWFHPLAWFARRAHADACDEVCDATAAGYLGDAHLYARTLARLALRLSERRRAVGLAMARSSRIQRRLEAVQRSASTTLPNWRVGLALTVACAASLLCGGLTISETTAGLPDVARPAAGKPVQPGAGKNEAGDDAGEKSGDADQTTRRMVVYANVGETDGPLAGVGLQFHGRVGGEVFNQFVVTDRDGAARFTWPANVAINNLWMTASKPGFVAIHHVWRGAERKIEMPAQIELHFDTGTQIGGTVKDEEGRAIAAATLDVTMPVTWPRLANYAFTAATLTTDADGGWTWCDAPAEMSRVGISVKHRDYLPGYSSANRGMNNVAVLKQGLQVAGRVVGPGGKAVSGVDVRLGFDRFGSNDPEAKTDAEGRFVLKNCKSGRSLVTVQAEGLSPAFQELVVSEKTEELRFQLERGHSLTVQVVDVSGNPVNDAWVVSDTWRGYRTLKLRAQTGADGRALFPGAPNDAVLFDVLKSGYLSVRKTPLQASAEPQKVTLYPELVISGRVTDAQSGKPIERFRLRQGWRSANLDDVSWSRDEATLYERGVYDIKFDEPMDGYVLQVIADGYLPATSRVFRSTEGRQSCDFALQPGTAPTGIVALPGGSPAAGAEVGLATHSKRAFLKLGEFDRRQNSAEVVTTDAEGRFAFAPQGDEPFLLVIVHEAGFAERLSKELQADEPIVLEPWGRIEGLVLVGTKPDADREVAFLPHRPKSRRTHPYVFQYDYTMNSDKDGRFRYDRVIPGSGSACRVVVTKFLKTWQHTYGWPTSVEVHPGRMTKVVIGGRGRPVVGSVTLSQKAGVAVDWTTNEPVSIEAWEKTKNQRAEPGASFVSNIQASGRFEVRDVPAGDYKLTIPVNNPPTPNACGAGTAIGRAELEFTVAEMPGGRSDEPLELGPVEATLFDTLDVGEFRPTL